MSPKTLVIVESPTKARTISRFLGSNFIVESSFGHIRDLPKSKLGVDIEHNFEPQYLIPRKAKPTVKKLKRDAEQVDTVILATDEDREGEAIAWHLVEALGLKEAKPKRIVFHEITKKAIEESLKHPREIDVKLVHAQQARRILDRLVGYKLSPFLWKKVYRGLSAGRVQSVAVRLIVEREREIQKFQPQEYWTIEAALKPKKDDMGFSAGLAKINDSALEKFAITNVKDAQKIIDDILESQWIVQHVEKRAVAKNPLPPFTTSTLQQDAFRRLGFSAKQTMVIAQQLYEGIELGDEGPIGLITYMRTDSMNLSEDALKEANNFIKREFGASYCIPSPRRFKTKSKGAQEAHEAIRPTDPARTPKSIKNFLDPRQLKLYTLIWGRFLATQMPQAVFDTTAADIICTGHTSKKEYVFRANGQTMKFDGFLKVYQIKFSETVLPELKPEDSLSLIALQPLQHFTEPPARFTEASLVKMLEHFGIGRPSTYAPIISTVQDRGYVEKFDRRTLKPTETGILVNDLLVDHFPQVVDIQFTAKMEEELDEIATGEKEWQPIIRSFYEPFEKILEEKYQEVRKHEVTETTNEVCEKCGKPMVVKLGRFGKFLACSGFPECKNTKTLKNGPQIIGMKCPKCSEGDIIIRRTKRGRVFFGCSRYPACDYASWTDPRKKETDVKI